MDFYIKLNPEGGITYPRTTLEYLFDDLACVFAENGPSWAWPDRRTCSTHLLVLTDRTDFDSVTADSVNVHPLRHLDHLSLHIC